MCQLERFLLAPLWVCDSMTVLYFTANIHLQVSTHHVCLSGSGLPIRLIFFFSVIHLSINFMMSFLSNSFLLHCVNVPHFLYHSLVEGHLGRFEFLATMNKAAMNIVEHLLGVCPRVV